MALAMAPAKMDSAVAAEVARSKSGLKRRRMKASAVKTPPKTPSEEQPRAARRAEAKTEGSVGGGDGAGQIRGRGGAGDGRSDQQAWLEPAEREGDSPE